MSIWYRLFHIRQEYSSLLERQRAQNLLWINWLVVAAWFMLLVVMQAFTALQGISTPTLFTLALTVILPIFCYLLYRNIQSGNLNRASLLLVGLIALSAFPQQISLATIMISVLATTTAATLLGRRGLLAVVAYLIISVGLGVLLGVEINTELTAQLAFSSLILLTIEVLFLYLFSASALDLAAAFLIDPNRMNLLSDIFARLETCQDEESVWKSAIEWIRDQFNYAFAQIYLQTQDEQTGALRIVRMNLGVTAADTTHQFEAGDANILSEAARSQTALSVTRADNPLQHSHFLPAVKSGAAIPLVFDEQIIGVLDIQSETLPAFNSMHLSMLGLLGQQIALNIIRVRERVTATRSLATQHALVENLQTRIHQLEGLSLSDLNLMDARGFDMRSTSADIIPASDLPKSAQPALTSGEIVIETTDDSQIISVPIVLQDEALGVMSFTVDKNLIIGERQREMLHTVSNRLALSVEAARLFERSQAQAMREAKAGEIGNLLISATDVQAVLDLAAEEFMSALGAINTNVYLMPGLLTNPEIRSEEAL